MRIIRNGPVERGSITFMVIIDRVTQVIISGPLSFFADWWVNLPSGTFDPSSASFGTGPLVIVSRIGTIVLWFDVLTFFLEIVAFRFVINKDSNIFPWGRMPVRIIISFFWAFKSILVTIVILTSITSRVSSVHVLISSEKTSISFASFAVLVVLEVFVHTKLEYSLSFTSNWVSSLYSFIVLVSIIRNSISDSTITNFVSTHVLKNNITMYFRIVTCVLISPFNHQLRTNVKIERWTPTVTSFVVVLSITKSVVIVYVLIGFVQSVVRAAGIMHVDIPRNEGYKAEH